MAKIGDKVVLTHQFLGDYKNRNGKIVSLNPGDEGTIVSSKEGQKIVFGNKIDTHLYEIDFPAKNITLKYFTEKEFRISDNTLVSKSSKVTNKVEESVIKEEKKTEDKIEVKSGKIEIPKEKPFNHKYVLEYFIEQGLNAPAIAKKLNCNPTTIRVKMKEFGLTTTN